MVDASIHLGTLHLSYLFLRLMVSYTTIIPPGRVQKEKVSETQSYDLQENHGSSRSKKN